jgi:type III pantothenate kinase
MLLAIDIGNTSISLGLFKKNRLVGRFSIATHKKSYRKELGAIFKHHKVEDVIISSVVPQATLILRKDLGRFLAKRPLVSGNNIIIPIINRYRRPAEVGQDRLVNAYAAAELYGAPSMVVDFGTAVTFDLISRRKEYLGGMILPGLRLSLGALAEKTALLPRIKLQKPREFIGRDTPNSMLSGMVHGFAALTQEMIRRIKDKIGQDAVVILTGGDSALLAHYIKGVKRLDADLTLKGLCLFYRRKHLTRSRA